MGGLGASRRCSGERATQERGTLLSPPRPHAHSCSLVCVRSCARHTPTLPPLICHLFVCGACLPDGSITSLPHPSLSPSLVYLQRHHGGLLLLRAVPVPHTAPRPGLRSRHSSTAQRDLDDDDSGHTAISVGGAVDGSRCCHYWRGSSGGVCGPGHGAASGIGTAAELPVAGFLHQVRGKRGGRGGREEALQARQRG